MAYSNFTDNGTLLGNCPTKSLFVQATGDWGGGSMTIALYDDDLDDYLDLAEGTWTSNIAKELVIGAGTPYRLTLAGASGPDLDVVHRGLYGG